MLGLSKSNQVRSWTWAAYGKHPAIKDYFRVGQDFPLLRVFSGWIENGYKQFSKNGGNALHNAWHFWARGATSGAIVCGLVKDSVDGIGRNYPLLMIGAGPLHDWEENWDLLPLACETVWRDMEYLTILNVGDLKNLEAEVLNIQQPQPLWSEFRSKKESFLADPGAFQNTAVFTVDPKEDFIPLEFSSRLDQHLLLSTCYSSYKNSVRLLPNVVFMGQSMGRDLVKFYSRPLTPTDFLYLWTAGKGRLTD